MPANVESNLTFMERNRRRVPPPHLSRAILDTAEPDRSALRRAQRVGFRVGATLPPDRVSVKTGVAARWTPAHPSDLSRARFAVVCGTRPVRAIQWIDFTSSSGNVRRIASMPAASGRLAPGNASTSIYRVVRGRATSETAIPPISAFGTASAANHSESARSA